MRPFQHLNPFDIKEAGIQTMLAAEINAININADTLFARRLIGIIRNDTTHADGQRGLARFKGRNAQRGDTAITQIQKA